MNSQELGQRSSGTPSELKTNQNTSRRLDSKEAFPVMLASLIVCTRNRAASLDRFLSCVVGLNLPAASDWEFLVVNNGSTDQTESVIAKYKAVLPIRSVFEPKAGLSNARNRGTDEARGDYIIWTDDDVVPHDDFICAYLRAFKANPNAVVFGGKILPVLEAPVSEPFRKNLYNLRYLVAHRDFGNEPIPLSVAEDHIPYGANFALRTKEQRVHRYDPNLGVAPGRRLGGEEVAVIKDLLDHGYSGVWVPESKVDHMISISRQHEDYVSEFYLALGDTIETMRFLSPSRMPPVGSRPPLNIAVKKRISHLLYVLLRQCGFPSYLRFLASYSYNCGALQCWQRAAAQRKLD
jgi:glycosyltransferase involved in cell wall biosynthesis